MQATDEAPPEDGAGALIDRALREQPRWGEMGGGASWEIPDPLSGIPVPDEDRDGPPTAIVGVIIVAVAVIALVACSFMDGTAIGDLARHILGSKR